MAFLFSGKRGAEFETLLLLGVGRGGSHARHGLRAGDQEDRGAVSVGAGGSSQKSFLIVPWSCAVLFADGTVVLHLQCRSPLIARSSSPFLGEVIRFYTQTFFQNVDEQTSAGSFSQQ